MSINLSFNGSTSSANAEEKKSVLRVKYRPAAIQPELSQAVHNSSLSTLKKVKEVEVTDLNQFRADREEPVVFLVSHAQVKRTEIYVASDEESYRRTNYPTIHERVDLQREWAHEQLKDARMASQREAVKRLADKKLQEARDEATKRKKEEKRKKQILKGIKPKEDDVIPDEEVKKGDEDDDDANDENSVAVLEEALQEAEAEMGEEQEEEPMSSSAAAKKRREDKKKFLDDLTDIKERKILASRDTKAFHREHSRSEAYRKAFWFSLGWRGVMRVKQAGVTTKDMTVVLPWLLIGRKDQTSNLAALFALGITHILNVTHDAPNLFPTHFVYMKIPVKDNNDADIGRYFKKIVNFIKRAENCKGRILVHCSAGSSRAPTAVIAYLVLAREIPLVDAFDFVRALRPQTSPNNRFLLQLALLEAEQGDGVSVYHSKQWRFYEFNLFRSQGLEERKRLGLFFTVLKLLVPKEENGAT